MGPGLPGACLVLILALLQAGCVNREERGPGGIHFTDGKFGFLAIDESPVGANKVRLSLVGEGDGKAIKAELSGSGVPYIVIDAGSVLGKRVGELREMLVTVGVERPDGEFYAVSGEIRAYSGTDRRESADPWSVYLPNKNPNIARAVLEGEAEYFVPDAYNFFILTRKVDNALGEGKPPSNLIIQSIRFLDAQGRDLPVNAGAAFNAPPGFGVPDRSNLFALDDETNLDGAEGSSKNWGQAVSVTALKNGGGFDPARLSPDTVITVYYSSEAAPELILQSWTDGAPGSAGWAKAAPAAVNDSGSAAQFLYGDMVSVFGTEDFAAYLDQFYVGDTGKELKVYGVSLGTLR
jgi:hypothetical protein